MLIICGIDTDRDFSGWKVRQGHLFRFSRPKVLFDWGYFVKTPPNRPNLRGIREYSWVENIESPGDSIMSAVVHRRQEKQETAPRSRGRFRSSSDRTGRLLLVLAFQGRAKDIPQRRP